MIRVAILGSTGSIGQSALSVVDAHPDRVRVVALAAGHNTARLAEQVKKYRPALVSVATDAGLEALKALLPRTAGANDDGHLTLGGCDAVELARSIGLRLRGLAMAEHRLRTMPERMVMGCTKLSYRIPSTM